jgi:hypothetical protein
MMNSKINGQNTARITPQTFDAPDSFETMQRSGPHKSVDTFETAPAQNFFGFEETRKESSMTEIRQLIAAAKAENKPPFSESNLNRLLAKNNKSYKEISGDLKNWINNNLYLTPRQKGEFDRMPDSGVKQIQVSADKATEMGKLIEVEIRDDDQSNPLTSNFEKTIHYEDTEIAENVKIKLNKLQIMPYQDFEKLNEQQDLNVGQEP